MNNHPFFFFYFFFIGSLFGSFTNVLIHRLPLNRDVIFTRSHCPSCGILIPWYYNIPLFSFIFLKASCFKCKSSISPRYLFCELFMGIMCLTIMPADFTIKSIIFFAYQLCIMIIFTTHFFIDLKHMILPNILNIILGLLFFIRLYINQGMWIGLQGLVVGLALPLIVTAIFYYTSGKIGLGGGDIKLYAVLGLALGPQGVIQNIFLSCLLGSVLSIIPMLLKKIDKNTMIPFGPFIIIVAWPQILYPQLFKNLLIYLSPS